MNVTLLIAYRIGDNRDTRKRLVELANRFHLSRQLNEVKDAACELRTGMLRVVPAKAGKLALRESLFQIEALSSKADCFLCSTLASLKSVGMASLNLPSAPRQICGRPVQTLKAQQLNSRLSARWLKPVARLWWETPTPRGRSATGTAGILLFRYP